MFNIELDLLLTQGLTWPEYNINLQQRCCIDQGLTKIVTHCGTVESTVKLLYPCKEQNETVIKDGVIIRDQSIEILSIRINGIKIPALMIEQIGVYIPAYRQDFIDYCKQSSIAINSEPQHVRKFWHAGTWTVALPENFWIYYNQLRPIDQRNDYTGNSLETIRSNLEKLKQLL